MKSIVSAITRFVDDEGGVTAIEYGLIAALIGVIAIASMTDIGVRLAAKFDTIATQLAN